MPLFGRLKLRSMDAGIIADAVTRLVAKTSVKPVTDTGAIDFSADFIGWDGFAFGEAGSQSGLLLRSQERRQQVICAITTSGSISYRSGTSEMEAGPREVLIGCADRVEAARFDPGYHQYFLTAPLSTLNACLENLTGSASARVDEIALSLKSDELSCLALTRFTPLISDLLLGRETIDLSPIRKRRCQDAFLEIVAKVVIEQRGPAGNLDTESGSARHVRLAEEYMRANCHLPIGIAEVAAQLNISIRALQLAFKRHAETTPFARLQGYRLEGLRTSLEADPTANWQTVAASWGFLHRSRLTRQYSGTFGETPAQTVRRARSAANASD